MFDLDQYYTPPHIAEKLIEECVKSTPRVCVDTTCGAGNLLYAASSVYKDVQCVGLDKDRRVIASLKRRRPEWILSVADMMKSSSYSRSYALSTLRDCDLLLLNPPFSQGNRKYVSASFKGVDIKCSVAMAYILKSFTIFDPNQGAVIIAPESVLYSETDRLARNLLRDDYKIDLITELDVKTFKGASAHSTVVCVTPKSTIDKENASNSRLRSKEARSLEGTFIRGSLPVHELKAARNGTPFVHTTDIRNIVTLSSDINRQVRTNQTRKGYVSGWCLLFPRVGIPAKNLFKPIYIEDEILLSDCVLAISCIKKSSLIEIQKRVLQHWDEFSALYKGTGARYVTIKRIDEWFKIHNVLMDIH